jgi:hypothetical protein
MPYRRHINESEDKSAFATGSLPKIRTVEVE